MPSVIAVLCIHTGSLNRGETRLARYCRELCKKTPYLNIYHHLLSFIKSPMARAARHGCEMLLGGLCEDSRTDDVLRTPFSSMR